MYAKYAEDVISQHRESIVKPSRCYGRECSPFSHFRPKHRIPTACTSGLASRGMFNRLDQGHSVLGSPASALALTNLCASRMRTKTNVGEITARQTHLLERRCLK